jgi:hypothetical protein
VLLLLFSRLAREDLVFFVNEERSEFLCISFLKEGKKPCQMLCKGRGCVESFINLLARRLFLLLVEKKILLAYNNIFFSTSFRGERQEGFCASL